MGQTKTLMTAEQIPETAAHRRTELVRGELVEMSPGAGPHGRIVVRLGSWLYSFVDQRKLGAVLTELGVVLSRRPDTVRAPDLCFIAGARPIPAKGWFEGAPDLAVEVVSPEDTASELQEKIREYLAAGARIVWLVDPQSRTVTAYHPSGDAHLYSGQQGVSGEDVLPGFSFRPADLFQLD